MNELVFHSNLPLGHRGNRSDPALHGRRGSPYSGFGNHGEERRAGIRLGVSNPPQGDPTSFRHKVCAAGNVDGAQLLHVPFRLHLKADLSRTGETL